jgi:formylglycine-generating enzyme required for sulfatase activity
MRSFLLCFSFLCLCLSGCAVAGQVAEQTFTDSIGMEFILIPSGSFMMGGVDAERPGRRVNISQPFYLGKYEVTQGQWTEVMGNNPSKFRGRSNPVEKVSWNDIQEFISRLNQREGHSRYRLPSEAEWEYAARGGPDTIFFFMKEVRSWSEAALQLDPYAWFERNSGNTTHPVGQKLPNPFGLYDVYGNVWEWVQDWYGSYSSSPSSDPRGPSSGNERMRRGGSWDNIAQGCGSTVRKEWPPDMGSRLAGFRLALSLEQQSGD